MVHRKGDSDLNSKKIRLELAIEKYGKENCTQLLVDPSQQIFKDIYFPTSNIEGWLIIRTKRTASWFYIYNVEQSEDNSMLERVVFLSKRLKGEELQYQKKCYQEEYDYQANELAELERKQTVLDIVINQLGYTPLLINGLLLSAYELEYFTCPKQAILSEKKVAVEKMHDFNKSHFEIYNSPVEYYLAEHADFLIVKSKNTGEVLNLTYYVKTNNWEKRKMNKLELG